MFEKLHDDLAIMDCQLEKIEFVAGRYFDGEDHAFRFPAWRLVIPTGCDSHRKIADAERLIKKALRNRHGYAMRTHNTFHCLEIDIAYTEDFTFADYAQNVADTFQRAFWQELHDNIEARADNARAAVAAGRAAIRELQAQGRRF